MAEQSTLDYFRYRLRRDTSETLAWFRANWREQRWFKYGTILLGLGVAGLIAAWALLARDLPDVETLLEYETPLPTVVRGGDGEIVHSYARERRVQLQYADFPVQLVEAYLAAEDRTFFSHGGVDLTGTANAVFDYASKMGSGERAVGGSTITQQLAKFTFLTSEQTLTRKAREMLIAFWLESWLTKDEILERYLSNAYFGDNVYGLRAASLHFFYRKPE
ncbi:MAG: transglycosylase domain-containing protein, partial [Erythrobacter sp.]|nr:transglycosylase domain-containing protein [Erythrobacter sp.]